MQDKNEKVIKENLVKSFIPNMKGIQDAQIVQEAWEAAKIVADDNLNLACIRLQADTVRQAFKEIDKRLEKEYRKRFDCRLAFLLSVFILEVYHLCWCLKVVSWGGLSCTITI